MEITKHNFNDELENIMSAIENCDYLAIDGEFTGLDSGDGGHAAQFDTPAERYNKLRYGATDFLLIQFGMCTFTAVEREHKYIARPYNFYIFPRPFNKFAPDRRFLCQSSSIDFLIAQGFDFNKLFKEGISYLTPEQETKLKAELDRKHDEIKKLSSPDSNNCNGSSVQIVPVPEDQKSFLNNICERITNYLEGEDAQPLIIPPCNAFQRKLIYQTVIEKFPHVHLETKTGEKRERYMSVSKTKNADDRLKKEQEKQALEKMELDLEVGFSKVIRAITKSGKLVVGHNMFLDVVHIINQFHSSLPEELEGFKLLVKTVLPRLVDTKLMASTPPIQEHIKYSSLDELRQTLRGSPFTPAEVVTADGFNLYDDGGGSSHEAGYDAFVTGTCFATMLNFLGRARNSSNHFTLPCSSLVEPFINKLFLMRIADIPYLNLNGPDLEGSRDHVFHVTFPKEWKQSDLHSLFQPYGNVQISWLTDTTCYVALFKKEVAKIALKSLSQTSGPCHVVSYAFHHCNKNLRWSAATPMPSPTVSIVKRKLVTTTTDSDAPPHKVKRHSFPTECPPIPEEDEITDHVSSSLNEGSKSTSGDGKKTEVGKDKMFEESEVW
ncbi:poly(A)-specific ribonuclease PARN-like isoform X1 [Biomphalaria glabrata]|uniref:Poly(A)-specific ribonuclease PARN n=2 Tax=Biomphalaria glabrata TaxID=6526 RepID=A0A9W2ZI54_BIOGL|nr:poly(A)-specific ribonuclease PARN-like isoform X1 [Biomphalaria glabrata]XP_055874676.1 poly(A)-specific ribonuclease PARN-like isoform X1 [Biomphalaria glabrata]XP_055874677.1 poly(A)-specific ribonuclease PARN-like isoform X1 [Biomphalaria glabrata]XP_055874678.1 poly(A)-specific ribonuclease PARN-like isoform X1 [Biomphalaria glabrata]XP_055874679.1 poly(A)-specific ribonuclease PARN-like isoform X1 [Biomphalaria glabrata]XP_055874680.1 poly(A)-specific ribonuclease PARN-like isoform X1